MKKLNSGITIIALTITVVVLIIIASVTIHTGTEDVEKTINNELIAELEIVRNAIFQQYYEYVVTKNEDLIIGEQVSSNSILSLENELGIDMNNITNLPIAEKYYRLTPEHLKQLKIRNVENTYIVNYSTGEILNETVKKTSDNQLLYKAGTSAAIN